MVRSEAVSARVMASKLLYWPNQNAVPCNLLDPLLVMTFTVEPLSRPNSALGMLVKMA